MNIHMAQGFDNRTFLDRSGFGLGQKMLDRLRRQGDLHFVCKIGDLTLGYCYIRKNACSSFKRMFLDMAPAVFDPRSGERRIDFMIRHHMMRSADAPTCDRIVFVYRDPVERIVSLFKNKFIMRDGHEDLFRSYADVMNEDPDKASFRRFVMDYLRSDFRSLDPHVLPQAWHLKRFRYTDAVPIDALHARMGLILGDMLANQYFAKPVNATASSKAALLGAVDFSAKDLARIFSEEHVMPRDVDLLDAALRTRLMTLYAVDVAMIRSIEARAAG